MRNTLGSREPATCFANAIPKRQQSGTASSNKASPSAAGLELLLWAPPAPAAGKKDAAAALAAARQYAEKFAELVAAGTPVTGLQSQEALLLHSWQQFLKRWLAAARAAAKAEVRRFHVTLCTGAACDEVSSHMYGRAVKTALKSDSLRGMTSPAKIRPAHEGRQTPVLLCRLAMHRGRTPQAAQP